MEKLPVHPILQFHPDTMDHVRKEHGLDRPGQMDAAIDLLDGWIKKQPHFRKKDFSREYLERTIVLDKGSVERAKSQLDKLFTMKTAVPQYFEKTDPNDKNYEILHKYYVDALLPKLTKDHFRIYSGKIIKEGITADSFRSSYKFIVLFMNYIRANDYCAGFVGIVDYRDINILHLVAQISLLEMHQFIMFIMEGYQMRVKGIHFLTNSKTIEVLVRMFKQVFSKKVGERIFVHATEESLHQHIPKEVLPQEFGGELKSIIEMNQDWVEEFGKKENAAYFKDMNQATVNENLRNGKPKINSELAGISGSFKTLCVD